MQTAPSQDEMLQAFLNSDTSYDGVFFTGVRTTGIFCKPSCTAKKALVQNVEFFPSAKQALFAGYRPCLRCRPLQTVEEPEWLAGLMAAVEQSPDKRYTDSDIRAMGIEPARVRRYFLQRFNMTFHAYSRARRLASAFTSIREGANLDEVVFDSGYESHSGFRSAFVQTFGKAPGSSRNGECIVTTWIETPIGPMVAGATQKGICLLEFTDRRMLEKQMKTLRARFRCAVIPGENHHITQVRTELTRYFAGELKAFDVPIDKRGTPFQELVWNLLVRIPYGATWSYEELATRAGNPAAVRAVARANGMNRIAILIPCHRVVNKNGELGGYGGGLWRKTALLQLEKARKVGEAPQLALSLHAESA